MFKSIIGSPKTACAISAAVATAAAVAGLMVLLTSAAPEASAAPAVESVVQQVHVKGDRLPNRISGSACSALSWPNYEQSCQFDLRGPARIVRIIALR
jgi:hypothetical protein